jgi:tetratricopeptide (TPR) repeat protein
MLGSVIKELLSRRSSGPSADTVLWRAAKLLDAGALDDASAAVGSVLALDPQNVSALRLRGRIAFRQRRFGRAQADYQAALALQPDDAITLLEAGQTMYEIDKFHDALALVHRAAAAAPHDAHAHYCHGLMLRELGKYVEAEAAMRQAQAADPASSEALCGLALVLVDRARHSEAEALLRQVLSAQPEHAVARWQLAVLLLLQRRFAEGWRYYAARWLLYDTVRPRELPYWDGREPIDGYLLVLAEQALGDEILFASCFDDLMTTAGKVIIECDTRLAALYARSFPQAVIWARQGERSAVPAPVTPAPVMQIAVGSLPSLYRTDGACFPQKRGYLLADQEKTLRWAERLAAFGPGPKVGVSWRGGTAKTHGALRSIHPVELAPLMRRPDITFISLQYGEIATDLAVIREITGRVVHHWPEAIADYDETAALVAALDIVITVQTAVAHLTGALGRPVWIILPASPEWRYTASGTSLPWYPSAELFRQRHVGEWGEVISAVSSALDETYPLADPITTC